MNLLLHEISLGSASAAGVLFSAIWEGALLTACLALCLRLFPGLGAAARSFIWMNVFLMLVLLHFLPDMEQQQQWLTGHAIGDQPFQLNPLWSIAIAGVWAVLSLWRGAQLILSARHLHGLARRATPVHPDAALQALLGVKDDGRHGRSAELCASAEVERPSVYGFFRPRILLPSALFDKLSSLEMRQVVMHEMEHLRRGDDWTNLLQKLVLVLFPLNPVLFWVERRLCAERELACDDRVLCSSYGHKAYAICLTHLAEFSMIRHRLSLALGAWERRSELARRVHRILHSPTQLMSGRQAAILTGCLILGVLAGAIGLAHSPRYVSFATLPKAPEMARAVPVPALADLQESAGPPRLIKAVMPQEPLKTPLFSNHRRITAPRRSARLNPIFPNKTAIVVLTRWTGGNDADSPPPVVIAIAPDRRTSFAGVAIANGWLIFQL